MRDKSICGRKLLADIDNSLSDDYKAVFKYNPPSIQNSFSEIKSDMLEQYKVAEKISSAQLVDGFNDTLGKKCCVFDKRTNEYILVPAQENRLKAALAQMGYDVLQTNVIVSEAQNLTLQAELLLNVKIFTHRVLRPEMRKSVHISSVTMSMELYSLSKRLLILTYL